MFKRYDPERVFEHKYTAEQLDAILEGCRDVKLNRGWQECDPDEGFWMKYFGPEYVVSFCADRESGVEGQYLAALEIVQEPATVTILTETFQFRDLDDAQARAVRLLVLSLGPDLVALILDGMYPSEVSLQAAKEACIRILDAMKAEAEERDSKAESSSESFIHRNHIGLLEAAARRIRLDRTNAPKIQCADCKRPATHIASWRDRPCTLICYACADEGCSVPLGDPEAILNLVNCWRDQTRNLMEIAKTSVVGLLNIPE